MSFSASRGNGPQEPPVRRDRAAGGEVPEGHELARRPQHPTVAGDPQARPDPSAAPATGRGQRHPGHDQHQQQGQKQREATAWALQGPGKMTFS
jgi:hypothetical protein